MIEAAGGVIRRIDVDGSVMVLVIHRRRHDDWSFPKGKLERGERHIDAALREVTEETGLRCTVHEPLPETRYRDRKGRPKRVLYWIMEPIDGVFAPNREVDQVRWIRVDEAAALLSYEHDTRLIETFALAAMSWR